jgi:hypothetical protein
VEWAKKPRSPMITSTKKTTSRPKSAVPTSKYCLIAPKHYQSLRRPAGERPRSAVNTTGNLKKQYGKNYKFCKTFQCKYFGDGVAGDGADMVKLVLTMDQYGDGKVGTSSTGNPSQNGRRRASGEGRRRASGEGLRRPPPRPRGSRRVQANRRASSAKSKRRKGTSKVGAAGHRDCVIHHKHVGASRLPANQGADAIYISQSHKELGSGIPRYRNVHNKINQSPSFCGKSIVPVQLYKLRKQEMEQASLRGPLRTHDNNNWRENRGFVESTAKRQSRQKLEEEKHFKTSLKRADSWVFRSNTKSRPSSAQYYNNFKKIHYELGPGKLHGADVSTAVTHEGVMPWTEAESRRIWNSKPTSMFGKYTSGREIMERLPIYNYKGGKIGYTKNW